MGRPPGICPCSVRPEHILLSLFLKVLLHLMLDISILTQLLFLSLYVFSPLGRCLYLSSKPLLLFHYYYI